MAPSGVSSSGSAGILGMAYRTGGEGSLGEEEDAAWSGYGQEVGEPGTLEFSKDKVPGEQEHGKG